LKMSNDYNARLSRYVCAMRGQKPDRVPFRPFAAELSATLTKRSCQRVTHDYREAFDAVAEMCEMFEFDAAVPNMVYVWTGLTQALGLKYYGIPGIDVPAATAFQYIEPPEDDAFMHEDEYDALIDDPTAFLYETWLPRVSRKIGGAKDRFASDMALVKGAMAMQMYFDSFGAQAARLKSDAQTPCAIAGIFKAPFDILADKLRGYLGLTMDMFERPEKVLKACEALAPHLCDIGLRSSDPSGMLPIGFWMHRGCKPFVSDGVFESHYWSTVKPIVEEFAKRGRQTLFYAEGDWSAHLNSFRELPDAAIVYHVDKGDILKVSETLGDKFCISGGVPNVKLAFGTPQEVRAECKKILSTVAQNGAYIMDASAIMQNEIKPENFKVMYETCMEFGSYAGGSAGQVRAPLAGRDFAALEGAQNFLKTPEAAAVARAWPKEKSENNLNINGDDALCEKIWNLGEGLGTMFIWQLLLSF